MLAISTGAAVQTSETAAKQTSTSFRAMLDGGKDKVVPEGHSRAVEVGANGSGHLQVPDARGASFVEQFWHCLVRSCKQQYYYKMGSFLYEMSLATFAALFVYKTAREYRASLASFYVLISPAPDYGAIVMMGLTLGFFIGIAGASPAVKFFTDEQVK